MIIEFERLKTAVHNLYTSARWHAEGPVIVGILASGEYPELD